MPDLSRLDKGSSLLLIDDSPAILALLRDLLRSHGFRDIRTAESAEDGLKLVEEREPDVIFLDLMMPDTSGVEFTKQALAKSPRSKIVLTTALPPSHEAVTMAVSQGASDYLRKPVDDNALTLVLHHLERMSGRDDRDAHLGYE